MFGSIKYVGFIHKRIKLNAVTAFKIYLITIKARMKVNRLCGNASVSK